MSEVKKTKNELQFEKYLNPKAFVNVTKAEFMETYKGKLPFDVSQAWNWIVKNKPKKVN
jgi:hypothetical protein